MAATVRPTSEQIDHILAAIEADFRDLPEYAEDWDSVPYGERATVELEWSDHLHGGLAVLRDGHMNSQQAERFSRLIRRMWDARAMFSAIEVPEEELARALQIEPVHA